MLTSVKTAGHTFIVDKIAYALVYPEQIVVYPVDYHVVNLSGDDAQRMNKALKEAGFVGEGTLINPNRISVIEDMGPNLKITIEGADRFVYILREIGEALFPALESTSPAPVKPRNSSSERRARKEGSA